MPPEKLTYGYNKSLYLILDSFDKFIFLYLRALQTTLKITISQISFSEFFYVIIKLIRFQAT